MDDVTTADDEGSIEEVHLERRLPFRAAARRMDEDSIFSF